jgi:hypothetical protein
MHFPSLCKFISPKIVSKKFSPSLKTPKPGIPFTIRRAPMFRGLILVGDQGVYLMDNTNQGLLADGVSVRDETAPENAHAFVAYADEINPEKLAFDEWWYNKRQAFGGDDGCCFISVKDAEWWINGTPGPSLIMELSPRYEPRLQIPKPPVSAEDFALQYQSGIKAGQSDCRHNKPAAHALGDIHRDNVNTPYFIRGYVAGYTLEEKKKCKTPKSKSARKGTVKLSKGRGA